MPIRARLLPESQVDSPTAGLPKVRFRWRSGAIFAVSLAMSLPGVITLRAIAHAQVSQDYHHTAWNIENGVGAVYDIQQASSGYLWLTTSRGIFRFDGVRFQSVDEVTNGAVHNSELISFFLSSTGGVWLTTRSAGLLLWKDGKVTTFPDRRCTPALQSGGVAEDRDGSLWIQASVGLTRLRGSVCEQFGANYGYPGGFPTAILLDRSGTLWVKMANGPLLFLSADQSKFEISPHGGGATTNASFLHQAGDGSIWLSDNHGLRRVDSNAGIPQAANPLSGRDKGNARFGDFTFAADDSMWVVTSHGVRRFDHFEQRKASAITEKTPGEEFAPAQGLSSDAAWVILVDREGSIWVGTNSGLDRLRRTALSMVTLPHAQEHQFSIAVGDQGSIWTGNASLPLTHVAADGSITTFPKTRQTNCVRRDRNGTIWSAGEGDARLWHSSGPGLVPVHYPNEEIDDVVAIAVDRNNDPWISTINRNVFRLVQGTWINQDQALGKKPGVLGTMTMDAEGNIWFGFSSSVVRWDGSTFQKNTFSEHNVSETTMSVRGEHVWLAGLGGVQLYSRGQVHTVRWQNEEMPGRVYGIVETETGDLWMNGSSGITHISREELDKWLRDPAYVVYGERLDALDGLPGLSVERFPEPSVVESEKGKLWFATNKGIVSLDPAALDKNRNRIPPPVTISSIISNGKAFAGSSHPELPPHTEMLEINYTALSLAIPARVLFRYKLEGIDTGWQSAGTRRQAFYTNLPPGRYKFHVIACNNDGVWNDMGAVLDFSIAPAWYQTTLFRALCVCLAFLPLWALYQLRVQQLRREEEKLREAIETIPAMVWIAGPDWAVQFRNRRVVDYTGLPQLGKGEKGGAISVHPEDKDRIVRRLGASSASGEPFEEEMRIRRIDGEYRWFLCRAVPLRDKRGKIVKWYGAATDIQDRRRAEELQAELAHTNRVSMLGELAASISHELKQPISAAVMDAQASLRWLSRDQPDLEQVRRATAAIMKDGMRAADIIDRLRSLYKKSPPQREPVDVDEIIGEMGLLMRSEANEYAVSIRTDLAADLPKITADRVQLQQVLMNLMLNGIEAMKETGGVLTVKTGRGEDDQVLISVSDTGAGLPIGREDEIFNAFFTTKPQGSGMGLAISRSIVESHGGSLWATSNDGQGATFHFTLPTAAVEVSAAI
jgi:PAS domain S-box-containing protein